MFNVQAKHPSTPTNLVFNNIIGSGSLIQGDQTVKGSMPPVFCGGILSVKTRL